MNELLSDEEFDQWVNALILTSLMEVAGDSGFYLFNEYYTRELEGKFHLTLEDLAKYPFLPEAKAYVEQQNIKLEDLDNPEYKPIVDRAKKRVMDSIHATKEELEDDK